jgi:hypothetical protein
MRGIPLGKHCYSTYSAPATCSAHELHQTRTLQVLSLFFRFVLVMKKLIRSVLLLIYLFFSVRMDLSIHLL